jgi:hypothetical protein
MEICKIEQNLRRGNRFRIYRHICDNITQPLNTSVVYECNVLVEFTLEGQCVPE